MDHTTDKFLALAIVVLFSSCGSLAPTASVRDDVYYLPSMTPATTSLYDTQVEDQSAEVPTDAYYDPNAAQELGGDRGYYDVAYNDPYYYNYQRFGFDAGVAGYPMGGGISWGLGMSWGYPMTSISMSMGSPWMNPYYGYGMYPYGGYPGWNSPWGGACGGYDPYGYGNMGYGYGGYNSPYGNCYSCYSPVVTGDSWSGTRVGHRPTVGGGGAPGTGSALRIPARNTVGLAPIPGSRSVQSRSTFQNDRSGRSSGRTTDRSGGQSTRSTNERTRSGSAPTRSTPNSSFGGSRSTPSTGGGGSGGGTRSSPTRR